MTLQLVDDSYVFEDIEGINLTEDLEDIVGAMLECDLIQFGGRHIFPKEVVRVIIE